jgi:tetratricopeptide (TPR) repeat protein
MEARVLDQVLRKMLATVTLGVLTVAAWAQAQGPQWKDRAEYDLVQEIQKAAPAKKIELLKTWEEKYPATEFKVQRLNMMIESYRANNQVPQAFETAKKLMAEDPSGLAGLYWVTFLTIGMNNTSPDVLDAGEKAAQGLITNAPTIFAPEKKPQQLGEADWKKQRTDMEALAHTTLGWIAMSRKNLEGAEKSFTKALELAPGSGQVSYWLGDVVLKQRKPETQSHALFHFARAGAYDGPGSMAPEQRQKVLTYIERTYVGFHGSKEGFDDIVAKAKASPFPPADFKIKSKEELALENKEAFKKQNPMLALWMTIKDELKGPNGQQYFENSMKGAALPGGAEGVKQFKGRVVSHKPATRPKEIVLAISDAETPEVTLKLDEESFMAGKADPGTEIGFEGTAVSYSKDPFMVIFEVEKDNISGWPSAAAAKPAGKSKKAPTKKK